MVSIARLPGGTGQLLVIDAKELTLEWRISQEDNLLMVGQSRVSGHASPEFTVGNESWVFNLYPNWKRTSAPDSGWLKLHLFRRDKGPPKTFHITVGIRGSEGLEKIREVETECDWRNSYCWEDFCSRSELRKRRGYLMHSDGTLKIACIIRNVLLGNDRNVCSLLHPSPQLAFNRSQSSHKQDKCTQTDCNLENSVITGVKQSSIKRGGEKALKDFAKLLASGEKSDVTVQVGDVEFKVHISCVISARSPALSVSIRHESKEKSSMTIVIEDSEPDVFGDYLQYIYTGSIQSLTEQTVFGLYSVADKYLADDLKKQCLEHIQDTLSIETFCDAVKLALTHGENELLQLAIGFATKNFESIVIGVEWQKFICEFPREANEILVKCFGPRSLSRSYKQ